MAGPNFRKMYNRFRKRKAKRKTKTKSNYSLTKIVKQNRKDLTALKKVNEPLEIVEIDNEFFGMNAESEVELYRLTQDSLFTSKEYSGQISTIPKEAYRKGSELYLPSIKLYLSLYNRQSSYQTRLLVVQFKANHDINRRLGSGGEYNATSLMNSNFCKWNIVGNTPNPVVIGNPGAGSEAHYASLMMKQPMKDVKDRYNPFHVLHDEVFYNQEPDQETGTVMENQNSCFTRIVYPKIKRLNFQHLDDDSPLNDIIAIVFNNYPKKSRWHNPPDNTTSVRYHALNWTYKVYDN